MRHGGRVLADQLAVHGVDIAFCVPGESYIALLDGLHDTSIRLITCRNEAGAANMAEAYGKLTGRPGVCLVTRGPGATHAAVGVHTAFQDSTPLVLLVGQVASDQEEREAFQEIDYRRMFGPMAKWIAQVDRPDRIPEFVARAFSTACAGRPGPVVLALPEDVLAAEVDVADAPRFHRIQPSARHEDIVVLERLLAGAARPLAILGGGGWTPAASAHMAAFLAANEIPAGAAFRRQDTLDNDDPRYVGDVGIGINPKLAQRVRDADLLLVVGPRLGEMTTSGYTLLDVPGPKQTLVHVHPGAEELGRVYQPALPILASPESFAAAVAELRVTPRWRDWAAEARAAEPFPLGRRDGERCGGCSHDRRDDRHAPVTADGLPGVPVPHSARAKLAAPAGHHARRGSDRPTRGGRRRRRSVPSVARSPGGVRTGVRAPVQRSRLTAADPAG